MIRFALKCPDGHRFDSWFQSADAFEKLSAAGHVSCAVCGGGGVEKAVMAPRLNAPQGGPAKTGGALSGPRSPAEQALARLRQHVEANSDYVGKSFAREARAIHEGGKPQRSIWGEARPDEARALAEDGICILPLPFRPSRKSN